MTINEAVDKFHWLNKVEEGHYEMFLDHHSLSAFRMCKGYFELSMMQGVTRKGRSAWSLEFGILVHKAIEWLYEQKQAGTFSEGKLAEYSIAEWHKADLDYYYEHKTYQALGGLPGFVALMQQYTEFYNGDSERLRAIATEVAFGKGREVLLGTFWGNDSAGKVFEVTCYLSGRIDFLMDNGHSIGPMDHKTAAFFKGDPSQGYDPQEGMTGYVFASREIIRKNFPELAATRMLDRIWMNYIKVANDSDPNKRFKRLPIFKSDYQLECFRKRQLTTFEDIFRMVYFDRTPDWNGNACNNWYFGQCTYKNLHMQKDESSMIQIFNHDFVIKPLWNPDLTEGE